MTALALGAGFVVSLWLPLVDGWLGPWNPRPNYEKRAFAEKPVLFGGGDDEGAHAAQVKTGNDFLARLDAYPRAYEAWYDDHFGLRSHLLHAHNLFKARVLATAPNTEVVIGRDDWLYYGGQLNIEQYRAVEPMPEEILTGWLRYFAMVREFVEDHGSDYVLVIGPSKHTIHPEYLPRRITRVGEVTRREQFLEALAEEGEQWVLDLTPSLLEAREREETYQETDTHWNSWGSLVATRALIDELLAARAAGAERYRGLQALDLERYDRQLREQAGGDVAGLMGLSESYRTVSPVYEWIGEAPYSWTTAGLPPGLHPYHEPYVATYEERFLPPQGLPTALVFHDSFGPYLAGFLPTFFARTAFFWQYPPSPEAVSQEEADVVIQEIGERVLIRDELKGGDVPFPLDERIRVDFERRRRFFASDRTLTEGPGAPAAAGSLKRFGDAASGAGEEEADGAIVRFVVRVTGPGATLRWTRGDGEPLERKLVPGRNVVYLDWDGAAASWSVDPEQGGEVVALEARAQ